MKMTVGMGSIDEYLPYAAAGADEVFCGYVPEKWTLRYGLQLPLNRREVRNVNVQLGSMSELRILADMREAAGVPVALTFNSLYYRPEQYALIAEIMEECADVGFSSFIVADPALLYYLKLQRHSYDIHVSGEMGEMNRETLRMCCDMGASRVIFHRKVTLDDMADCIRRAGRPEMEYEAFVLNELCHFHGGFCHSLHCDELEHSCRLPYRLGPVSGAGEWISLPREAGGDGLGMSGCGLCALWKMERLGITHLKLVGRGNYPENTLRDIRALRQALEILEGCDSQEEYVRKMKRSLFPDGCPGMCYYRPLE